MSATPSTTELTDEIDSTLERVAALTAEGNFEGAGELAGEALQLIEQISAGTKAKTAAAQKPYQEKLAAALRPTPAQLTATVREGIEELRGAVRTNDKDGAAEIYNRTEAAISQITLDNKGDQQALRKTLRAELADAKKPVNLPAVPPKAEPKTLADVSADVRTVMDKGAARIKDILNTNVNGNREIAEMLFDIRLRTSYEGLPDLNAEGWESRMASKAMFDLAVEGLPEPGVDERADEVREGATKFYQNSRNAMNDVKVLFFRAMDQADDAAKAPFAALFAKHPTLSPANALATHYFDEGPAALLTRAEKAQAKREIEAQRKEIAAKPVAERTDDEAEILAEAAPKPADQLRKLLKNVDAGLKAANGADVDALDEADRSSLAQALKEQMEKLTKLQEKLG